MRSRIDDLPKKDPLINTGPINKNKTAIMGCFIVLILAAAIVTSGCINKVIPGASAEPTPETSLQTTPLIEDPSALPTTAYAPVAQIPVVEMTPAKSEAVIEVTPILTPDPYPILHGTRINATPLSDRLNRAQIFEKKYHLTGGAEGLLVNVAEGPMYIVYEVTPLYDCMVDDCRGDITKPIQRPYLVITVRDNQTQEIIAEDGYAREFSWDNGHYEFSITTTDADDTETTTTSTPGPRYIPVNREGTFHITIEGAYLDADLRILTGPTLEGLTETDLATAPAVIPPEEIPPEEMFG